jgi:hypothetical protein
MSTNLPSELLEITMGDQKREVFMSYGLLNELLILVGSLERVGIIGVDPTLRNDILTCVLTERDANGKAQPFSFTGIRLSAATVHTIIEWVGSHVIDFFLTQVENTLKVMGGKNAERLLGTTNLMSSSSGSAT